MMTKLGATYDGHSMVTYEQLTHWGQCREGKEADGTIFDPKHFAPKNFDYNGDGIVDDFTTHLCDMFSKPGTA